MPYSYHMGSPPSGNAAPGAPGLVAVAAGFDPVNSGFAGCWLNVPWSQVSCSGVKGRRGWWLFSWVRHCAGTFSTEIRRWKRGPRKVTARQCSKLECCQGDSVFTHVRA